jgi:two-component system, NtrC family, nitrogen regulation response regulator NtrX
MPTIKSSLLILDQSGGLTMQWGDSLAREYDLEVSRDSESVIHFYNEIAPDLLLAHMEARSIATFAIGIRNLCEKSPDLPIVLVLSDNLSIMERREILKENIFAHVESGIDADELKAVLGRALLQGRNIQERLYLRQRYFDLDAFEMGGSLASMHDQIQQAATSGMGVMIYGEPGSGRRDVAKKLHLLSDRANNPFVVFNPTGLSVEDCRIRLFGREGRDGLRKKGYLEIADGGSMLLEELGNLPAGVHAELYRVLVEGRMTRIGGIRPLPLRIRIMATSNLELLEEVRGGSFHEGLFNKIHVFSLAIPSLTDRREDIPALLVSYLRRFGRLYGKGHLEFDRDVEAFLSRYPWSGSLEELRKAVELAVLRSTESVLRLSDFGVNGIDVEMLPLNYKQAKKLVELDFKRRFFDRLLKLSAGKVTQAAKICGIPRPSLSTMLKEAGVKAAQYKHKVMRKAAGR